MTDFPHPVLPTFVSNPPQLMWQYAEVTGNARWREMSLMMMPSLASAMAACTWHFFYNSKELEFLVVLQAGMTVLGNCTLAWGAFRLWEGAQEEAKARDV